MKIRLYRKIELVTNIVIIATASLLCVVLVKNYLFSRPAAATNGAPLNNQNQPRADKKLSLPEIDWAKSDQTIVLALSATCHFCSESAPFYQQLAKERSNRIRIIAVLPQPLRESENYLNGLGVSVDEIKQASLGSINVRGTPTLLIVNGEGLVVGEWVGRLPAEQEAEVLSRVQGGRATNLSLRELKSLR